MKYGLTFIFDSKKELLDFLSKTDNSTIPKPSEVGAAFSDTPPSEDTPPAIGVRNIIMEIFSVINVNKR